MKNININALFPLLALALLTFALSQQMFNAPPVGKLLDPFIGIVRNEEIKSFPSGDATVSGMGLTSAVRVFFDDRKVPHIYAANDEDLYFAQGYITASLRLWQMDFISYAAAGRLSEIFKDGFLKYDRHQRRLGILQSAKASLEVIEKQPETYRALTAYTRGVNAYIRQLTYKDLPFEYKFLDYSPEPWSNLKSVLIMKYMANMLSGYEEDVSVSNMMLALGEQRFNKYFPSYPGAVTPIAGGSGFRYNPSLQYIRKPDYLDYSFMTARSTLASGEYNPKLGSNSWAVSGKKTRSGHPILCCDPHLSLSLPSIWIEMQLTAPELNVYGVSIPGTPAIIIGFNRQIAWGITNGADDVRDWYKLKTSEDNQRYEWDEQWKPMRYRVEEIRRRDQAPFYDTVYSTIHGPVVNDKSFQWQPELTNYALRWVLHDPSNEFLTFIKLNKAQNYQQFKEAIKGFSCPVQNFTFACRDNTIAITHQGKMAEKSPGLGKFLLDGTRSVWLPARYIPEDSLPQMLNPACNYVVSANQHPTGDCYPYYYNGYYSERRANRIKQLLDRNDSLDLPGMEAIQLDNTSIFAVDATPVLMSYLDGARAASLRQTDCADLSSWQGKYDCTDRHALFFEKWWNTIKDKTWDEFKAYSFYSKPPDDYVLLNLLRTSPQDTCFDIQGTPEREDASDIIRQAFDTALKDYKLRAAGGNPDWGTHNKVNIMHMTNIKAFSDCGISSGGYPEAINAVSYNWGPSWRMVVQLGDRPEAYGIYPGGQSGAVGNPHYDDFVKGWNKGVYYPLQFYLSSDEAARHCPDKLTMK